MPHPTNTHRHLQWNFGSESETVQPRQHIKKQRYYFANKGLCSQGYCFSSGHVWMWELDCEETWAPNNWCFWTVLLEKTLESPLDWKEVQPVHPKGNQSWVFIGRTYVEAETPILWLPDAKSWLIWKDPDTWKDWRQKERGMTKDEMAGWHHQLDGREFEWTLGVGNGQGGLVCCGPWRREELDTTERLNWTELKLLINHPHKKVERISNLIFINFFCFFGRYCNYYYNTKEVAVIAPSLIVSSILIKNWSRLLS